MKKAIARMIIAAALVPMGAAGCGNGGGNAAQTTEETTPTGTIEKAKTIVLGNVTATWICDNAEPRTQPARIFLGEGQSLIDSLGLQSGVPSSMSAFLVETGGAKILFDTGLGSDESLLTITLEKLGVKPQDLRYIYLTHFHNDHIGGMLRGDTVVFTNAEVYASRAEYEAWMNMSPEENALQVQTMEAYKPQLRLFEFGDTLPGGVTTIDASGHTPGHTAFQTGKLLIAGDIIHGAAVQLDHPEVNTTFDMDKPAAAQSRQRLLTYAAQNALTIAGMHLPEPAFLVTSY